MSEQWQSVRLDEVESISITGAGVNWRPLRRTLGINAYVAAAAGDDVVEEHSESQLRHEEVYLVLTGHATFTLGDETLDAPAGTVVSIRDPDVRRSAVALEASTAVLAVGGKAYSPSAWEWFFYAERFRPGKDWDGGVAFLEEGAERYPDHAGMLYSLACFEAMADRHTTRSPTSSVRSSWSHATPSGPRRTTISRRSATTRASLPPSGQPVGVIR